MLFAQRHGLFRSYHDTVFRRFWSHDLEIDELSDISGVIADIGGSPKDSKLTSTARRARSTTCIIDEAEALGVFACPPWPQRRNCSGRRRIDMLIERIKQPETIAAALGAGIEGEGLPRNQPGFMRYHNLPWYHNAMCNEVFPHPVRFQNQLQCRSVFSVERCKICRG